MAPPASDIQSSADFVVDSAINVLKGLQNRWGPSKDEHETIPIPAAIYPQLLDAIECDQSLQGYIDAKVRWDYDPRVGLLCIRMPTPVHDFFAGAFEIEIYTQLQCIANGETAAGQFAQQIHLGRSSRIYLKETDFDVPPDPRILLERHPDSQFQYLGTAYPGVVLEVSYSKRGKKLRKLAQDYILYSNGDIKVVIGVDIKYGETKEATVSLWRPICIHEEGEELDILSVQQEIKSQPFRAQDGSYVNQTERLRLDLSDFATDELSPNFQGQQVEISYQQLAQFLTRAEHMYRKREISPGFEDARKTEKRRLSSSDCTCKVLRST